ncbi:MAG TPA: OmpA family protein [Candidatus Angelobacter sp.]|nr:OmpA family protein [Candidatus Angelobacter sp.]
MAVAQYLRPVNLLDTVKSYFSPELVRRAASLVGESESSTRQALNGSVPAVLLGLTNMVSSRKGADNLARLLQSGGYASALENPLSLFRSGRTTTNMLSSGQYLLGKVFGNKSLSVAETVARFSGVKSSSAASLLSLAAPIAMGVVERRAEVQGLDAAGLAGALLGEKPEFLAAAPAGLAQVLNAGPRLVVGPRNKDDGPIAVSISPVPANDAIAYHPNVGARSATGWLPMAFMALGALALLLFVLGHPPQTSMDTALPFTAPAGGDSVAKLGLPGDHSLSVPQGSMNYYLGLFLADPEESTLPRTFVFDHLNFEDDSSQFTAESTHTVTELATLLKAYPNTTIQIVGHTDSTGPMDMNQKLSVARADAIKEMLVNQGVGQERIATSGLGEEKPVASNDTEAGRARNRRIELIVTQK